MATVGCGEVLPWFFGSRKKVFDFRPRGDANLQHLGANFEGVPKTLQHNVKSTIFMFNCPKEIVFFGTCPIIHYLLEMI